MCFLFKAGLISLLYAVNKIIHFVTQESLGFGDKPTRIKIHFQILIAMSLPSPHPQLMYRNNTYLTGMLLQVFNKNI